MNQEQREAQPRIGNEERKGEGYMRALHSVEEKLYGPDSPFPGKTRVFLYIRHYLIRWDLNEHEFGNGKISQVTGVKSDDVRIFLKALKEEGLVTIKQRKHGKQFLSNIIGLNKAYFGEFIEQEHKPKLTILPGGKLSTPPLKSGGQEAPDFHGRATPDIGGHPTPLSQGDQTSQDKPPPSESSTLKNPLKEPLNNSSKEIPISLNLKDKEERREEKRRLYEEARQRVVSGGPL